MTRATASASLLLRCARARPRGGEDKHRGSAMPPPVSVRPSSVSLRARQARRRNQRLDRDELLTALLVDRDRAEVGVPGAVDRERADDAVGHVQAEDALGRSCPLAATL